MADSNIQDMCIEELEDIGEDDLIDFLSEGDGDNFDDLEAPVQPDNSFPCTVFICNAPVVGVEKSEKLKTVLSKLIKKYGEAEVHMPLNEETNKTFGFVLANYDHQDAAKKACATLDGMSLDKAHQLKVVSIDTFDEIIARPDTFQAKSNFSVHSRVGFRDWLRDSKCREQFLIRYHDQTEIYWHDTLKGTPELVYGGERERSAGKVWCDFVVQWSPQGSYLATFHMQGIALWAGDQFERKGRLVHEGENKFLDFAPTEEFALTWNGAHHSQADDRAVRIFRVLTGECVFQKKTPEVAPLGGEFPHFLWSPDAKYFAECTQTRIFIRETKTFEIIKNDEGKKKSLNFETTGLATFQWSPRDNVIAAWSLEKGNNPARLTLYEVPSLRELSARARTGVEATMQWHSEGDFLALLVTKVTKTGKKGATNVEIFRMRDKNIPVEIVELKDNITGFFWEPKGKRFALISADEAGHNPKLSIYALLKEKCERVVQNDLPSGNFNQIYWAPDGQYFVLAAVGQSGGEILFCGVSPDNKFEVLHKEEHFMLTEVRWSPCSRYVITGVNSDMRDKAGGFRFSAESGFKIWTFHGRQLFAQQKEKLYMCQWRPHPPTLLAKKRVEDVRKDIRQFSKRYDAFDDQAKEAARNAFKRARDEKMNVFKDVLDRLQEFTDDRPDWAEAVEDYETGLEWTMEERILEEELGVQHDEIKNE